MAKPSSLPIWATDPGAEITNPGASKNAQGWVAEIPPHEFFNHWQNLVYQWIAHFDTQNIEGQFDASVGAAGSHATIADVLADMDGVTLPLTDVRIFVIDPQTLTTTTVINKEGVEIIFHPAAHIAKGASLVTGIQVDANRVKLIGGRFLNFDEVGGKAIELTANAKNCFIERNSFNNVTEAINVDLAPEAANVITNNIEEVA